MENRYIYIY